MTQYKLVTDLNKVTFQHKVQELLDIGYKLHGMTTVTENQQYNTIYKYVSSTIYIQALVRD